MKKIISLTLAVIMTAMLASCFRQGSGDNNDTDAKKGEVICKECGILIYFAKSGDSVWDVGKKYRVSQKCVCDSMQGKEEISDGMKLIIPVFK